MRATVFFGLCVVALSLLEFRAVELVQGSRLPEQVETTAALLAGHPYWKAYQNRLLGPVVVSTTARWTGLPTANVYQGFCFVTLCVANALAGSLLRRPGGPPGSAWGYGIAYAGLFVAFQDSLWLYLWDYVDLATLLLFAWAVVVGEWSLWLFALLFVVELANRESAEFIALWLVLDSLRPDARRSGVQRLDERSFSRGGAQRGDGTAGRLFRENAPAIPVSFGINLRRYHRRRPRAAG